MLNRELAIKTLRIIAEDLAKEYGYDLVEVGENRKKGFWGEGLTELLEKDFGDCSTEIYWYKDVDSKKGENIHFRYRFSSPCLSIRKPGEVLCEIQLSDYDYETQKHTGDYDVYEVIVWKREGLALQKKLLYKFDSVKIRVMMGLDD